MEEVERVATPLWLESLTDAELWAVAGIPRGDDALLQERLGIPREKRRPLDTLTTDQLLRIARGDDIVKIFMEEESNIQ